ncbi:ATP-binding cassette domain-containing protein [Alteromonadaceae bacterium M269]|nr:ATP-binding cassette domain-containing protein [Alteromonadaceae bacterium M269]
MKLEQISLSVGSQTLIENVELFIEAGKVTSLMGASGSGKSTLLSYISGTLNHKIAGSGRILVNGQEVQDLPAERRKIGLLFQDALLFPHLNVGENLGFGLSSAVEKPHRRKKIQEALERAQLTGIYDKNPVTLSGGERSRVALMRTLLAEPDALLLDEPFSRLDEQIKQSFREFVFETAMEKNIPVLMVTHDIQDTQVAQSMSGGPVFMLEQQQIKPLGNDDMTQTNTRRVQ